MNEIFYARLRSKFSMLESSFIIRDALFKTPRKGLQHTRKSGENISENGMLISVMLVPENWCRISSFHLISRFKKKN